MGGRCAEEYFFGKITTGAYDDLQKAYQLVHNMVTKLGMSDELGYSAYMENNYGRKVYSEAYNRKIDEAILNIINECKARTLALIKEREKEIRDLSETLLKEETLDLKRITEIIGERPFEPKSNFKEYLAEVRIV